LQFAPTEDFAAYPRDIERDVMMAERVGVDCIFFPEHHEMYPEGFQTHVEVGEVTQNLCGISRPRFFRGVTTVCTKLFHIVKPHVTVFGRKDFQQYVTIKKMVMDLNMDIEVIGMQTTREPDGVAMSSRNIYLSKDERKSALSLIRSLQLAKNLYEKGEGRAEVILKEVRDHIVSHPNVKIDYAQICDSATMKDVSSIYDGAVLALAVWVGKTRLIDNYVFGESLNIPKTDNR
jgi:pantoate--beta-alanine ligase